MSETKRFLIAVGVLSALIGSALVYHVWRVHQFAHATGLSFWKAFFVLGN